MESGISAHFVMFQMSTWMSSEQDPWDLRSVPYTLHSILSIQHLVLWSDLSKVSLDKMAKSGNCLMLRALTSGSLLVVWSEQSHITQVTTPRATRSSWRSSKRAGWKLYGWLMHTFFFSFFSEPCHWHVYLFLVQGSVVQITGVIAALVMVLTVRWWTQRYVSSGYDDSMGDSAKTTDFFPGWVQRARSIHVTCEPFYPSNMHTETHIKLELTDMI